jgi:nucleoid-associated protein YgaU
MRSQRYRRPLVAFALCAMVTLASGCFGGQPAAQATPTGGAAPVASPPSPGSPSPLASPGASPSPAGGEQTYTVEAGDTLATVADKFYGDSTAWRKIYDANKSAIGDDPDKLKVGTQLRIPPKD